MWKDFGEYIATFIPDRKFNVGEVAIGHFYFVSDYLNKKDNVNIIKTDIEPSREDIIKDDLTNPDYDLYRNLDLIYSIRPPHELQPYILNLARNIKSYLIIKPLTGENLNPKIDIMKMKNYKKASFYVYDFKDNE
ncbi:UPF0146 family protein [Methanobrevibacter boviskoreani]|uniref:UPF0146 family protein n=1 Tax=Methanobrevibacter boviskoreani TaxID=1348249 RepID=UPI0023A82757|nr:UPF0146 family protein [Methanobrevibacter boviskoreani]MCI6775146.1 hypothetical protein [Methanobrevibacter boviskoreani]MCI6930269.1 hypothetical protein [Methanobrevibacter boviskoreani]MDD6256477.1 UPF0146 family protein [Methanobrevibacter boviskoreani]MDY5614582.1 UPF0146 family protein [Methanobrevibacter boviskoreani]